MEKGSILFVDDELPILRALFRLFRESGYTLHQAASGEEALAILKEHPVDLVISDMRMPQMSGYELLSIVKEKYPSTMRIILSGYSQEREIFRSLLDGASRMYLLKPWDNLALLAEVEQLFKIQKLLNKRQLLDKMNEFERLPTLPELYEKINKLIEEDADIREITQLIEEDQVIAVKVLKIANSAFCGVHTGSLKQAVAYLGLAAIKNIILACTVFNDGQLDKSAKKVMEILWSHANMTNMILQTAAEQLLHKRLPEDRASIGLVHNIGKVVLLKEYGARYVEVFLTAQESGRSIDTVETEAFSLSHQEIGGYLLNWWNLPYAFVEAAMFHHDPLHAPSENRNTLLLLHAANYYAWKIVRPTAKAVLQDGVFEALGIGKKEFEDLVSHLPR
ncbi:response regulator [Azotosporobacter soli]|uniref:response regulator n=1 Tax=Azotosporobacter soli TaxID=3055040 RepID=UPI0031FE4796